MSVVDPAAGTVIRRVRLGASPTSVAVDPALHVVYVAGSDTVWSVRGSEVTQSSVPGAADSEWDQQRRRLYVSQGNGSTVAVLGGAPSRTTVTAAPERTTADAPTTILATIQPADAGAVRFTADDAPINGCEAAPVDGGRASCTARLPVGTHRVAATYGGSPGLDPSSGAAARPVVVSPASAGAGGTTAASPATGTGAGIGLGTPGTVGGASAPDLGPSTTVAAGITPSTPTTGPGGTALALAAGAASRARTRAPSATVPRVRLAAATSFVSAVRSPSAAFGSAAQVAQDAALALLLLALLSLPVALVNATADANVHRLSAGPSRLAGRLHLARFQRAATSLPLPVALVSAAAVGALLYTAIQPAARFDRATAALAIGVAVALAALGAAQAGLALAWMRRQRIRVAMHLYPGFVLVAVGCVLLSRIIGLQPGLLLGPLSTLRASEQLERRDRGQALCVAYTAVLVLAVVAWSVRGTILSALGRPSALVTQVLAVSLTTVVVGGAAALTCNLVPLTFLNGAALFRWSRPVWAILFGAGALLFVETVIHPAAQASTAHSAARLAALLGAYLIAALAFWAWFRFRYDGGVAVLEESQGELPYDPFAEDEEADEEADEGEHEESTDPPIPG